MELQDQGMALQFEHPTVAGVTAGGWMNRIKDILKVFFLQYSLASHKCCMLHYIT